MADSTISALTAATTLQDADLGVFVQSGTTKKATLSQILAKALPLAGGTSDGGRLGPSVSMSSGKSASPVTLQTPPTRSGGLSSLTTRTRRSHWLP